MRTNQSHTGMIPFHNTIGKQYSRDTVIPTSYEDGLWNGSRRYVH